MRKVTAFYAWQSDTPEKINRHFIRIALDEAARRICADSSLGVELVIESDTEGVLGQAPVTDVILEKIDGCDIFIPDLTFVARTEGGKLIPNPNVLTEYGYAFKAKTYTAMMAVMNTAFGPPEQLPFDMGHLRHPIQYRIEPTATDGERREARRKLSEELERILRLHIVATKPSTPPPALFPRAEAKDGPARFRAAGEPIANRWDMFPTRGSDAPISMMNGAAVWLRLMPTFAPGKKWETYELEKHAVSTGRMDLAPFVDHNIFRLRGYDGMGICSLITPNDRETTSVAFAFETGEIWSIDTTLLQHSPNDIPFLETYYEKRLRDYARFLFSLGVEPPYTWICGITGAKGRRLQYPAQANTMRIPGWPSPQCLIDTITEEGAYDGKQTPSNALFPFFRAIFAKCGLARPDYLPH
jgi:hypothetical protein